MGAISTAGASPDVLSPTAAIFIFFGPFVKSADVTCVPAIRQSPLECVMEARCAVWGDRCPPRWLEVWDGGPGRLAGGKSRRQLWRQNRRKCGTATNDCFSLVFLSDGLSFCIAGRCRLDADIGQGWRRRRPMGTPTAFHSISSQLGKRPSSTSPPPIHRATAAQAIPEVIPARTIPTCSILYSPPHHRTTCHSHPVSLLHPIPRYMSDSPPPHSSARTQPRSSHDITRSRGEGLRR
jgi:hypothetical protein